MTEDVKVLFEERLKRYQAAIALEIPDRIPISAGSNYLAEVYAGYNHQQFIYDPKIWMESDKKFVQDFPEIDNLRSGRFWGILHDVVGWNMYKLPGRDLPPTVQFQFIEGERMKSDEYDILINNPIEFFFDRFLPRVFNEFKERGSVRSYIAFLKGGMATVLMGNFMRQRAMFLENELGMPLPMAGVMLAPFDYLADGLRGLKGIMLDIYRQPDKVLEACEAIIPDIVNAALANADPLRRYPIFMPLHRGNYPFLSPKQFDTFYWPSLKKAMMKLIEAGYTIRAYLEGDWGPNWYHFCEMPKGKIICDIDDPGDIFKAKEDLKGYQCIAGGMPNSLLILGTPEDVKERTRLLCEKVGKDGGYIINGGCGIHYQTKPENYRAMIDAVLEYGRYYEGPTKFEIQMNPKPPPDWIPPRRRVITPWDVKVEEMGKIMGDEKLIRDQWEDLEHRAYNWLWMWTW